jgi:hypothetical protein
MCAMGLPLHYKKCWFSQVCSYLADNSITRARYLEGAHWIISESIDAKTNNRCDQCRPCSKLKFKTSGVGTLGQIYECLQSLSEEQCNNRHLVCPGVGGS